MTIANLATAVPPPPANAKCKISCTIPTVIEMPDSDTIETDLNIFTEMLTIYAGQTSNRFYTNGNAEITAETEITAENGNNSESTFDIEVVLEQYELQTTNSNTKTPENYTIIWNDEDCTFLKSAEIIPASINRSAMVILSAKTAFTNDLSKKTSATQTITICWSS